MMKLLPNFYRKNEEFFVDSNYLKVVSKGVFTKKNLNA